MSDTSFGLLEVNLGGARIPSLSLCPFFFHENSFRLSEYFAISTVSPSHPKEEIRVSDLAKFLTFRAAPVPAIDARSRQ